MKIHVQLLCFTGLKNWFRLTAIVPQFFSLFGTHHLTPLTLFSFGPKKISQLFSQVFYVRMMFVWWLRDCFKIAFYLLHTQNNDRALQKTFFPSDWTYISWVGPPHSMVIFSNGKLVSIIPYSMLWSLNVDSNTSQVSK